ncbi:MAG: hypothetical protein ACOYW7_11460 [Nitrospirota bacterium]
MSDSLFILKSLYAHTAYITDFVAAENIKGLLKGYKGLAGIKEAVKEGWLQEVTLSTEAEKALFESLSISMGLGEASSIAVAKERGFVFACDDRAARREASFLNVKLTGTIGILVRAARKNITDHKHADDILKPMVTYGFYSPVKSIRELL